MSSFAKLGSVSLDCADPTELARFYAGLLGVDVAFDSDSFAAIKLDGVWLSMQRVDDYRPPRWPDPVAPQQLHLDFAVSDLEAAEARALGLGATKAAVQPAPERYRVLLDPASHPFCLTTQIPE
jgi:catechol 2,3-dioxygenase-like lactoylglutathione lyase family enzyme